jgi:hypothetical protein
MRACVARIEQFALTRDITTVEGQCDADVSAVAQSLTDVTPSASELGGILR